MTISVRSLTKSEAEIISDEIKNTDNISGYLISELLRFDEMIVTEDAGEINGILFYKEYRRFVDMKLMIVCRQYRGQGIGRVMFLYFLNKFKLSNKTIYTVTKNPQVVSIISRVGFKKSNFLNLPFLAQINQISLMFSLYRIKEFFRKKLYLNKNKFYYWILDKSK